MKSTKTFSQLFSLKGLKLACLTPILKLKEEQVFHIHVSRLAFLHLPTLKKGSQKVSKTINKLHNCPCGLFIRPLAKREHPNEHLYLIWQQKKKSQVNVSQTIQRTVLKNSSGPGKKVFIRISILFINIPYTQLIYHFNYSSQSIFIFL